MGSKSVLNCSLKKLLIKQARTLPNHGKLRLATNGLLYVSVDSRYIDELYEILPSKNLVKPGYFTLQYSYTGAHISVIYPDELKHNFIMSTEEIDIEFEVIEPFEATLNGKRYIALKIESKALTDLRKKAKLPLLPHYKGYTVDFHITIALVNNYQAYAIIYDDEFAPSYKAIN